MWIKQTIGEQRKVLTALFEPPMLNLAEKCVALWSDSEELDKLLCEQFNSIPHSYLIYALDKLGKQVSANVTIHGIDTSYRGQDLSRRPYSVSLYPKRHFVLSSVYISQVTGRPCISAVQPVIDEQQFLGFIVADFDIRQLPLSVTPPKLTPVSRINDNKHNLLQHRVTSLFDQNIGDVVAVLEKLITTYGVFHCTVHYASAQVMLWQINDPYQYRLYSVEQLLNPEMLLAYPRCPYTEKAVLPTKQVKQVLQRFSTLRLANDSIYLRSASVNIINGMVGLSFSYDGSQYMPADLFLSKGLSFWFGQTAVNAN